MKTFVVFAATILALSTGAGATSWYVEVDGSSGYSTIQSAVDVAASGDTICIGPGFYNDIHILPEPLATETAVVHVTQEELTLIGAGDGQTVIGQDVPWVHTQGYPRGIHGGKALGNEHLTIRGVRFQNLYHGVLFQNGGRLMLSDCLFIGSHSDLALYTPSPIQGDEVVVEDCVFEATDDITNNNHIWSYDQNLLIVRGCQFRMEEVGERKHILCSGRETIVEQCDFYEGRVAVGIVCEHTSIRDCMFDGQEDWGLMADTGYVLVEDCLFRNQFGAIYSNDYHERVEWAVQRVVFENVTDSTFRYHSLGDGFIRDCILAKGPRFVVRSYRVDGSGATKSHFDMTDNWWGATDPDSIQAWIWDAIDEPEIGYTIIWDPYKDEPVAAEKKSLGDIRAMYR